MAGPRLLNGELDTNRSKPRPRPTYRRNTDKEVCLPSVMDSSAILKNESFEKAPLCTSVVTFIGFYFLIFLGYINQCIFTPKVAREKNRGDCSPLYGSFENFYLRYIYRRIKDCFNKPICSVPGAEIVIKERITRDYGWTFELTGTKVKCLNLGSYNYLGFAEANGTCGLAAIEAIKQRGIAMCSPTRELGTHPLITELEQTTARFLGVDDSIVCGMGFATNTLNIPTLVSKGCLVVSDEKNHASLILGLRLSGASYRVFQHNNTKDLERKIVDAIVHGQPNSREPWRKILIIVEGVFSMEGSIINLPEVIRIKKQYKAYLYLDEAHSIGAMGKHGRGILDYYNCDAKDVDILMGTFTKSFASAGGYIAGTKKLIDHIRVNSHSACYGSSMSPPIAQQILSVFKIIMGEDGTNDGASRLKKLSRNTRYFRRRLHQLGVIVYGNSDSPVVPLLVYTFSKLQAVVRSLASRKIAVVGVGYPATPVMEGRIRFCLSSAHTKEHLDYALEVLRDISDELGLRYSSKVQEKGLINYESDSGSD